MSFNYQDGILYAENVNLVELAQHYGTPCYVYSQTAIEQQWHAFDENLKHRPHLICYAVKANSNLSILRCLAQLGSGFDIVSGGELERVLRAGGHANKIVFSGVGKTSAEIERALTVGIRCFNVESEAELLRINHIAGQLQKRAPISFRVNPDVDAKTHPYISTGLKQNKFGVDIQDAPRLYQLAKSLENIEIMGVDCHIGSQLTETTPFKDALVRVLALITQLKQHDIHLHHIDFGGGLGVRYREENPPSIAEYIVDIESILGEHEYELLLEPGRAIVANAGILLTTVEYLKNTPEKNFAVIDAAMNDLIRPALYSAWQNIIPVQPRSDVTEKTYDLVGAVCETGDFLGKDRPLAIQSGDILAVLSAGAYGFTMSSNYNTRPRAAEVMVSGSEVKLIRRRETLEDLLSLES